MVVNLEIHESSRPRTSRRIGRGARRLAEGLRPTAVDAHAHVWPHGLMHPSQRLDLPLAAEPKDLLAAADSVGVGWVVIIPASIHEDNRYVLQAAAASPSRLRALVVLDPWADGAVDQLTACSRAGAIGVRIAPRALVDRRPTDLAALGAMVDAASALGLVVQWTVPLGATGPIEFAAARRPELTQLLDHLGLPADATDLAALDRIRDLAAIPGLRIKLSGFYALSRSGYPYSDVWPWAAGAVEAFGPERCMWASDWPLSAESTSYAAQRALVDRLPFLDGAARIAILSLTARSVWSSSAA